MTRRDKKSKLSEPISIRLFADDLQYLKSGEIGDTNEFVRNSVHSAVLQMGRIYNTK